MKEILLAAILSILLTAPVHAQQTEGEADTFVPPTEEEMDSAVQAINELATDEEKVEAYCAILAKEDALEEGDTEAADAVEDEYDAFLDTLEPDAQLAFAIDEEIDPATDEAQRLGGAFLKVEDQCAN